MIEKFAKKVKISLENRLQILNAARDLAKTSAQNFSDEIDNAQSNVENLLKNSLLKRHVEEISDIKYVLKKIAEGTYGVCEDCGQDIDLRRLEAKMYSKFCIKCRIKYEKSQKGAS